MLNVFSDMAAAAAERRAAALRLLSQSAGGLQENHLLCAFCVSGFYFDVTAFSALPVFISCAVSDLISSPVPC